MKQKLLMFAILLLISSPAFAVTRYASPTGTGTACTDAQRCSLSQGIALTKPGDTLILRAGTYATALTNPIPSGTSASSPTILEGESKEGVIIKPSSGGGSVILFSGGGGRNHIVLRKLTVDAINLRNGETSGIRFQNTTPYLGFVGEDIIIRNMQGPGLVPGSGMKGPTFRRITIHNSTGNNQQSPHGIYTRSHGGLFEDIEIFKIPCMGVNVRADASGSRGNIFRRMNIHDTGYNTQVGWNCGNGNDSGFDIQQPDTTVENSTIHGNADNGVRVRTGASAKLLNNTFYGNKRDVWPQGTTELVGNVYTKPVPIPPDPPKPDPVPVSKPVEINIKSNGAPVTVIVDGVERK